MSTMRLLIAKSMRNSREGKKSSSGLLISTLYSVKNKKVLGKLFKKISGSGRIMNRLNNNLKMVKVQRVSFLRDLEKMTH